MGGDHRYLTILKQFSSTCEVLNSTRAARWPQRQTNWRILNPSLKKVACWHVWIGHLEKQSWNSLSHKLFSAHSTMNSLVSRWAGRQTAGTTWELFEESSKRAVSNSKRLRLDQSERLFNQNTINRGFKTGLSTKWRCAFCTIEQRRLTTTSAKWSVKQNSSSGIAQLASQPP